MRRECAREARGWGIGNSGLRKQGRCLVGLHWRNRGEMNSRAKQRSYEVTCPQPLHFSPPASSTSPCPIVHLKSNVGEDHPGPIRQSCRMRCCSVDVRWFTEEAEPLPHASVGSHFQETVALSVCLPQKL